MEILKETTKDPNVKKSTLHTKVHKGVGQTEILTKKGKLKVGELLIYGSTQTNKNKHKYDELHETLKT